MTNAHRLPPDRPRRRALLAGVLVALFAAAWAAPAGAQIYRWTDASGRERFTQQLSDVPAEKREAARSRWQASDDRVSVTGEPDIRPRPAARAPTRDRPSARSSPAPAEGPRNPTRRESANAPGGLTEGEWRAGFVARLHAVRAAERAIAQIESGSSTPTRFRYSRRARRDKDRARWERNKALRDNQRAKAQQLAAAAERLANEKRKLAEFRERARRAGVPPGWVRMP